MEFMINDEILYLNKNGDKFPIKICKEKLLTNNIYWSFTTVALANSLDDLHHSFREQYIGSNHYLSDEGYVFDYQNHMLSGVFLDVPDSNFDGGTFLLECLKSELIEGIPYALNPIKFNAIRVADFRYLSNDLDYLVCISKNGIFSQKDKILRIRIHERLDLFFINNEHCGFILKYPIISLVRFADFDLLSSKVNANQYIDLSKYKNTFISYFNVMDDNVWDKLEERNIDVKNTLNDIVFKLRDADLSKEPLYALKEQCTRLLSDYYE